MSGRDLLYKPTVPVPLPEESSTTKPAADKVGVKVPHGRDLGGVPGDGPVRAPVAKAPTERASPPAFKAAYFNKDISGVKEANLRQSNLAALRGAEGASDLKKVVLPPAIGIETPDPAQIRQAGELMGLDGGLELNLQTFLGRQGAFAKAKGVTVEMIEERLRQLEAMVTARRAALARMLAGRAKARASSVTLEQADAAKGKALDETEDLAAAGGDLVRRTAAQAEGMHLRLAKALGIKRQK
ncbi:MAG: hypothetical protein HY903_05235 [Deltaproteobacteria bacterium]|nr:hypothetical protein [Deltaproteobacteria bacterium]